MKPVMHHELLGDSKMKKIEARNNDELFEQYLNAIQATVTKRVMSGKPASMKWISTVVTRTLSKFDDVHHQYLANRYEEYLRKKSILGLIK